MKFKAIEEGWLWAPREWTKVTKDTGIGDPSKSTVEKGEAFLNKVIAKLSTFFVELAETDIKNIYVD